MYRQRKREKIDTLQQRFDALELENEALRVQVRLVSHVPTRASTFERPVLRRFNFWRAYAAVRIFRGSLSSAVPRPALSLPRGATIRLSTRWPLDWIWKRWKTCGAPWPTLHASWR